MNQHTIPTENPGNNQRISILFQLIKIN